MTAFLQHCSTAMQETVHSIAKNKNVTGTFYINVQFLNELHMIVQVCKPKALKAEVAISRQYIHL
jgi:hypothetical protein